MDHSTMFTMSSWVRSKRKMFQSRMAISLLIMVNYGNTVILMLEAFGAESPLSFVAVLLNTVVVMLAMYGIFTFKPIFLTPNVIAKVSLSSAALFHGLQEAESSDSTSAVHFTWLLVSVCLYIWEIHAMFSTTFGVMKEMRLRAYSKPPPTYNQVIADELPPPSYAQAILWLQKPLVLSIVDLEAATSTSPSTTSTNPPLPYTAKTTTATPIA